MIDLLYKLSMISIGITNAYIAVRLFALKSNQENERVEQDRRLDNLRFFVLQPFMVKLHDFFDDLKDSTLKLRRKNLSLDEKKGLDVYCCSVFINIRQDFVHHILAVDPSLHDVVLQRLDLLADTITNSTFDESLDLSIASKYDECIGNPIAEAMTDIIGYMVNYRG